MLKSWGWGGVVAHVILVSAQGPNPSFFFFWGTFHSTWGPVGTWDKGLDPVSGGTPKISSYPGPGQGLDWSLTITNFGNLNTLLTL